MQEIDLALENCKDEKRPLGSKMLKMGSCESSYWVPKLEETYGFDVRAAIVLGPKDLAKRQCTGWHAGDVATKFGIGSGVAERPCLYDQLEGADPHALGRCVGRSGPNGTAVIW